MFTGIITDVGEVAQLDPRATGVRLRIATRYDADTIDLGASIACSGICLTVVERGKVNGSNWFDVEASVETLARTNLGGWTMGRKINLERALKIGDELGGHIVSGHVDGLAEILSREDVADMSRFTLRAPHDLSRFIAEKGSVALDGTSLTVNTVSGDEFTIMLIPHTLAMTAWGASKAGDQINLEIDTMARYAARLADWARM